MNIVYLRLCEAKKCRRHMNSVISMLSSLCNFWFEFCSICESLFVFQLSKDINSYENNRKQFEMRKVSNLPRARWYSSSFYVQSIDQIVPETFKNVPIGDSKNKSGQNVLFGN